MDLMPQLPKKFQKTRADFRRVLLGVLSDRNRWNRCVDWTNKKLGMSVGALFIRDNFNYESKVLVPSIFRFLGWLECYFTALF